ncbi:SMI1/KNR4 family protein [Sedimentibacter hydroxybenzoicus DSM 7310]|uniref:SMI1/KNR4 family protein n=1 Tax=Sedimentibacter hydroxybenzoicus DSM 7310 TaxID=1123245 RepID=A0A974GYD2_SEDHY|nr:SMI1/KNR4 family protein [Sedimentibacter hydroxybenzoicus]NYB76135.1 SMI1/KNR4 family protein [Sedimentibacter hydroxybenzoicus DSM 7310]
MWKLKILDLNKDSLFAKLNPPATETQIYKVSSTLKVEIPDELESLLKEVNGDGATFLSTEQIIRDNLFLRELEDFMPLDVFLFFAENGCGDYFGYSIRKNGEIDNNIFMWDHESDSRKWVAQGLDQFIERRKSEEI